MKNRKNRKEKEKGKIVREMKGENGKEKKKREN